MFHIDIIQETDSIYLCVLFELQNTKIFENMWLILK